MRLYLIFSSLLALGFSHMALGLDYTVTRITNIINAYPDPSPDGSRIVFQSDRTGTDQIYLMNTDGSDVQQLTEFEFGAETPVWSPDGKKIAYAAYTAEDNNDVFIMNPDGTDNIRLTNGPGYDGHAHWAFNGQRIVFNSDRSSPDLNVPWNERWHEIHSIRADGSDIRQHSQCRDVCTYGSISPNGEKILFRKVVQQTGFSWDLSQRERNSEVFIADIDGSNEQNISSNAAFDGWPVWSPDGTRIAFASNRSGPARVGQLFIVNADGTAVRQITSGPWSYAQPAWSKDGSKLYAYQLMENDEFEFGDIAEIDLSNYH